MAEAKVPDEVAHDPYKLLLYKKALRKGKERENTLRINIVGNFEQGKTSLANRLIGRTCEGVTSTNGIEVSRHRCQISGDGSCTLKTFENKSQEFVARVATIAHSAEISKRLQRQETNLEECLKNDHSVQTKISQETSHPPAPPSNVNDTHDIVMPSLIQTTEVKKKKRMALSSEELESFSDVVEKQNDIPPTFIDIWDFGGQYINYATHTLFHSSRALYLLVFDLTKHLDTIVRDEEFPGETGDRNMEYFARFWLESINAYVGPGAQVILVGTHKDKLEGHDPSGKEYFEKVKCLVEDTELIKHIQKEHFAVDNYAISDPGIADLTEFILKKHKELAQPIEVPARWLPLEKALRTWQASKIILFQDVIELDKENEYPLQDEEQIKLFLHHHHEKGTLFYDEGNFVCLDPKYLIDAFKCIITSEHFCKDDPDIRPLWKTLSEEGRLSHRLIDKVWSNSDEDFMKHKGALLGFLKKHNIIAEVEYNAETEENKQQDSFIVPSLLKNHCSNEEMDCFLNLKTQSQVRFSMKFEKQSCVHMLYSKTLAAGLGIWPVVYCRKKLLLFENMCVFELDRNHAGLLEKRTDTDSGTIELRVINLLPKPVESHLAGEFRRFVESVVLYEFRRVNYHKGEKDKLFSPAYRCNHADHGPNGGSRLTHFKEDKDVLCPDNVTHESFDHKRAKEEWSSKNTIGEVFPNMQLTEKTLSKLAQLAIGKNWQLLGPELKLKGAEIDQIEEQNKTIEMQIYKMLLKWKDRSADKATLDMLVEAIKKCPGVSIYWDEIKNIRDTYLREQKKQTTDLIQPLSNKTVEVKQTLTLECEITTSNVLVTWFKGDEPIIEGGRKTITSNKGLHQLVIRHVTIEDAAKYALQFGESKTECIVTIEDPCGNLKFVKELVDIEVGDTNSPVSFTCELNTCQVQVEWYYRKKPLYPSNKYTITVDGSVHMLTIKDVSEQDQGRYMVLANGLMSEAELYMEETEEERYLLEQHRKKRKGTEEERYLSEQHRKKRKDKSQVSKTEDVSKGNTSKLATESKPIAVISLVQGADVNKCHSVEGNFCGGEQLTRERLQLSGGSENTPKENKNNKGPANNVTSPSYAENRIVRVKEPAESDEKGAAKTEIDWIKLFRDIVPLLPIDDCSWTFFAIDLLCFSHEKCGFPKDIYNEMNKIKQNNKRLDLAYLELLNTWYSRMRSEASLKHIESVLKRFDNKVIMEEFERIKDNPPTRKIFAQKPETSLMPWRKYEQFPLAQRPLFVYAQHESTHEIAETHDLLSHREDGHFVQLTNFSATSQTRTSQSVLSDPSRLVRQKEQQSSKEKYYDNDPYHKVRWRGSKIKKRSSRRKSKIVVVKGLPESGGFEVENEMSAKCIPVEENRNQAMLEPLRTRKKDIAHHNNGVQEIDSDMSFEDLMKDIDKELECTTSM